MSWAKLDDRWDDCPELNDLSADAVALFLRAQARTARLQTDGVLTARDLDVLDQSRPVAERERIGWPDLVAELMGRGLLIEERDHWLDPGWLARNPSHAESDAARAYDAIRQRLRYAKANRADDDKLAALKGEESDAKRQLYLLREARQAAASSLVRLSRTLTPEKSLTRESHAQPHSAPSHPVPSRPNEDEDEDDGIAAGLAPAAAVRDLKPLDTVVCSDYPRHQTFHRFSGKAWVCDICSRQRLGKAIREAPEALKAKHLASFERRYPLYPLGRERRNRRPFHPAVLNIVRSVTA